MDKAVDIPTEVAKESWFYWDDLMREVAFDNCEQEPKNNSFCETSKKCISRGAINKAWIGMVSFN